MTTRPPAGAAQPQQRELAEASALHQRGQLDQAALAYRQVLRADPRNFDALHLLGVLEGQRGRAPEAADILGKAVRARPGDATALMNYGNALLEVGRLDDALAAYDGSLRVNPGNAQAHYNRGVALADLQRPQEALDAYTRVAALRPDHAEAHYGRGNALSSLLRTNEATAAFDRAIALQPDRADFYLNKAFINLLAGDFVTAWPLYEWRWGTAAVAPLRRTFAQPLWRGDTPLAGKTILLHAEQGFGDTLHFCRYAPLVAKHGASVVLEVQPSLAPLLRSLKGVDRVVARGEALPPFDVHCPILSLPLAFKTTLESIPAAVPYLAAEAAASARWQLTLGRRVRPRVGVAWSGSGGLAHDQRSLTFAKFATALPDGADYICLQKEVRPADADALTMRPDVRVVTGQLADFADTAALAAQMDLVVSVDTSVAHLAGALGKPLWLVLGYDPTWRWLLGRSDSPWYPTAQLYRQPTMGDWSSPLQAVRAAVAQRFDLAG